MSQLESPFARIKAHLHAALKDHGILRALYRNLYQISSEGHPKALRSNHPSPAFIKKMQQKHAIKTILSVRRADTTGAYLLEKETCDQLGIRLVNHAMSSRQLPSVADVLKAKALLESIEYPILIHCKSGADRAGMMSVFYKHFIEKQPIEEALAQLSMKYGHFRWADTGKLDFFFDDYLAFKKQHPDISFETWLTEHYDQQALNAQFKAEGWANIVVNKILHRE
ncbi:protein-tyrosine-phosphatase [Thiosulfatimonas sediminis]|uniref:Protein-tyrosine-phosphatase n=1 Tax=Thiosulfatimonas sediminis TaxID=2675054 RepID=A0A6F8PX94_9GAMM|nr:protein-tyrosine-phosphatase [Thiosulfatimonas sediminis]BBP46624.1 protein-tyrosine-phosphatase [Thiosulfatimonas sediminis]